MLTVAVTGGIGSGKTAVSDAFAALGVPVIDTDLVSRELVRPGEPALARIREVFGDPVLASDGTLDRAALGRIVFSDRHRRQQLEAILHPAIRATVESRLAGLDAPYALLVVPLLVETGAYDWVDRVLVVDVPEAIQIERVMQRDGLGRDEVTRIMESQVDRDRRLARADEVLENTGSRADLARRVTKLHERFLELAAAQGTGSREYP